MNASTIWRKTLIFSWINLGIGLLTFFICLIIGMIAYLMITRGAFLVSQQIIIGCSAFLIAILLYFVLMSRFGYGIKMGQLAIVERAQRGEDIPTNPIQFSKGIVQERFASNRKYYALSRDLTVALRQITRVISRGFTLESESPVLSSNRWMMLLLGKPALSYADECCMAYALRRRDYEVNAACIDGMTVLVQNWKAFIGGAVRMGLVVYTLLIVLFFLFYIPGLMVAQSLVVSSMPWAAISFFLVWTLKIAFVDSYVLTRIVCRFFEITEKSSIDQQNYVKLDAWSKMYAKLRQSAQKEADKASPRGVHHPQLSSSGDTDHEDGEHVVMSEQAQEVQSLEQGNV